RAREGGAIEGHYKEFQLPIAGGASCRGNWHLNHVERVVAKGDAERDERAARTERAQLDLSIGVRTRPQPFTDGDVRSGDPIIADETGSLEPFGAEADQIAATVNVSVRRVEQSKKPRLIDAPFELLRIQIAI